MPIQTGATATRSPAGFARRMTACWMLLDAAAMRRVARTPPYRFDAMSYAVVASSLAR